jgi:hypothetical protein
MSRSIVASIEMRKCLFQCEHCFGRMSFSSDGSTLYLMSDSHEGSGNRDLFMTTREKGVTGPPQFSSWSAPVNLGKTVNSSDSDSDSFISEDGRSLYYNSTRPGGYGGLDIWGSQRASADDPWGAPQNLGHTINTSDNEQTPTLSLDGHWLYAPEEGLIACFTSHIAVPRARATLRPLTISTSSANSAIHGPASRL